MTRAARSHVADAAAQIALGGPGLAAEVAAILDARGLSAQAIGDDAAALTGAIARGAAAGWAADEPISAADATALAPSCDAGARAGRPVVVLAPPVRGGKPRVNRSGVDAPGAPTAAVEHAAALAYLLAHGAIVADDPDVWLEALVLVAAIGVPAGPRAAVIAAPGSWIDRAVRALGAEAEARGVRAPVISDAAADLDPTDAVLVDRGVELPAQPRTRALIVPIAARAELLRDDDDHGPTLVGVRAALAAVIACGRAAERAAAGLGPARAEARDSLEIDDARATRQLDKASPDDARIGDHEAKVLLAAYGVPITRQAVATTPSAAIRVAKKAGYPVELKPWGADVASERAGCPVEKNVMTAAEVRRAFLAVLGAAGMPVHENEGAAVIVREAPPQGREVTAIFEPLGPLGWTCIVEVAGAPPVAAPAPLCVADAERLALAVASTRAGEAEPDRAGLANVLRRASHLAVDHAERFAKLELGRIVIGARGARTLVVDASIELRQLRP